MLLQVLNDYDFQKGEVYYYSFPWTMIPERRGMSCQFPLNYDCQKGEVCCYSFPLTLVSRRKRFVISVFFEL